MSWRIDSRSSLSLRYLSRMVDSLLAVSSEQLRSGLSRHCFGCVCFMTAPFRVVSCAERDLKGRLIGSFSFFGWSESDTGLPWECDRGASPRSLTLEFYLFLYDSLIHHRAC